MPRLITPHHSLPANLLFFLFAYMSAVSVTARAEDWYCSTQFASLHPDTYTVSKNISPPYLRVNEHPVHMDPAFRMMAVVFEYNIPSEGDANKIAADVASRHWALKPHAPSGSDDLRFWNYEGAVLLFDITDPTNSLSRREILTDQLRSVLGRPARIGVPFNIQKQVFGVLDQYFVVRFAASLGSASTAQWLNENHASPIAELDKGSNLWHLRFDSNDYCRNLFAIEFALERKILKLGTADVMLPLVSHHDMMADKTWPNDPRYWRFQYTPNGGMHRTLRVREAWNLIHTHAGADIIVGSEALNIASIDLGIDLSNSEISDARYCKNRMVDCLDPARPNGKCGQIWQKHGKAVFGVISSCTNNKNEIAGIAPAINHVAYMRPQYTGTKTYAELLIWAAGLSPYCWSSGIVDPNITCPPQIPRPVADVINSSYTVSWDPIDPPPPLPRELPIAIDTAFNKLIAEGRQGRGAVLVFSAGNEGRSVDIYEPFARDDRTIGVANCWWDQTKLIFHPYTAPSPDPSNYGLGVDVCAVGEGSETLLVACQAGAVSCPFGGTSSAAAAVSGIAALVLTAKTCLSSQQVRDILKASSSPYDFNTPQGNKYGQGVVNAFAAVTSAMNTPCQ